jgi:transcriptional regulator with XRE-family HTH domain
LGIPKVPRDPVKDARDEAARERMKEIRKHARKSQDDFACWLGISKQAYGKKERGESDGFSVGDFVKILEETKIDARWLFGQIKGPVAGADLTISNGDAVSDIREVVSEYRVWKDSLSKKDSLSQRIMSDPELLECVELLLANRSMVSRVTGYVEGHVDEKKENVS